MKKLTLLFKNVVFKKKLFKFNFHQNAKSECLLTVQKTKIKF